MIKIFHPRDSKEERRYSIDQFFEVLCGYQTSIEVHDEPFTLVVCQNDSKLILHDSFFNHLNPSFPNASFLPKELKWLDVSLNGEKFHLPILFGNNDIEVSNTVINLHADILAGVFFMLTRWEESIPQGLDKHDRFPLTSNWTFKHNVHQVAIVDRYVHFIRALITSLDKYENFKNDEIQISPSHDLDHLKKWKGIKSLGGALKKALFQERSFASAFLYSKQFFESKDPFDNVSFLMDLAEEQGRVSTFYFLPQGNNAFFDRSDFEDFSEIALRMKSEIIERGHEIGLHGSYDSYNNEKILLKEKKLLEEWLGTEVRKIRQHYLRFEAKTTWPLHNKLGFEEDATLGFAEMPGFRSGTTRRYCAYHLLDKCALTLKVYPLLMMDTSYLNDHTKIKEDHEVEINQIRDEIKRFGTNWHFLIHNSSFFWQRDLQYSELWKSFYRDIK